MAQATLKRNQVRTGTSGAERAETERTGLLSAFPAIIKAPPPLLELQLHLTNGATRKFIQNDSKLVQLILGQVGHRVFAQPASILHDQDQVTAFSTSALEGLSILTDLSPSEFLPLDPLLCLEITQEEFEAERHAQTRIVEGEPFLMLSEVEMSTGRRLWFALQVPEAMSSFQERQMLHNAFSLPNLSCRRLGGGISIWNRAQMISCSFCPKPNVPGSAWPLEGRC